jgi:hypothetical protein
MAYRYRSVCTSDLSRLEDAVRSDYPVYLPDGVIYDLPSGNIVHIDPVSLQVSYVYTRIDSAGVSTSLSAVHSLSPCVSPSVFDVFSASDVLVIVFFVFLFILGFMSGSGNRHA